MQICFLGSGSSGNCAVVRAGKFSVLVDAGLSLPELERRLKAIGGSLEELRAILVTHEHSDHVGHALRISKKLEIPIYCTPGTSVAAGFPGPLFADLRYVGNGRRATLLGGDLEVRVTATPHDGVESVCYVFQNGTGAKAAIATDLGHLSGPVLDALRGCEVIGLEFNHDVDMLRTGPYPLYLKRRILSAVGHLSNEEAAAGLARLVGPRTRAVVVLHVSRHNNTAVLARRTAAAALARIGAGGVALELAPHDHPTRVLDA